MSDSHQSEGNLQPKIVRGRVDSLSLYEITDYELQILEQGSVGTIHLNFAIFLLSIATSFLVSLMTATIDSINIRIVFVVLVVIGYTIGFLLLLLWWKTRKSQSKVIKKIKDRCYDASISTKQSTEEKSESSS